MAHIDDSFKAALYRITCPDSATLGNYHLGLLSEENAAPIVGHLAICPHCTQEIAQLEAFLVETAVSLQPSTRERIKIWVAKRLPSGGQAGDALGTPAFALRGGDTGPMMFEAGDAQLSLAVQEDPEHPGRKSILGLVLGIEADDVQATLFQGDEVITAVSLDDLGNFTIANLQAGQYALILTGSDIEIHLPTFAI